MKQRIFISIVVLFATLAQSQISPTNPPPLIGFDATWRYDQSGADLSATFATPAYNDSGWPSGPGVFGVEVAPLPAPINTPLTLGITTYYFRRHLTLTPAQLNAAEQFYLQMLLDDAGLVYINGVEVLRLRLPPGPVTASTSGVLAVPDATVEGPYYVPREHFVAGDNVIAVEVHQTGVASSDVVFALALHAQSTVVTNSTPPVILQQPASQTVEIGGTATFHVEATGTPPLGYRWRHNGASIFGPGATTSTFIITNVQPFHAGTYTVVVTNSVSPSPGVVSGAALLTVITPTNPPVAANLIALTDNWHYEQSGVDLGPDFPGPIYNHTLWPQGPALLGFETAPLPAPLNTRLTNGLITYYFRRTVDLSAAQANPPSQFFAHLVVDDGAIVYVNGAEVLRLGMPEGPTYGFTLATRTVGDAMLEGPFAISAGHFVPGPNIIAVEVHQSSSSSSDLVFGMALNVQPADTNLIPPTITEQPESQTLLAGGTATFHVAAEGTPPLGYRWRRNGIPVPNATSDTLVLSNVQSSNAGIYTVIITNPANPLPGVVSAPATLTVIPNTNGVPPVITRQPSSGSVLIGVSAAFEITATGTPPLSYQWRRNGVPIPGATSASFESESLIAADDGVVFSVVVSNPFGSVTSDNAVIQVIDLPPERTPVITQVQPTQGPVGTLVGISGSGFEAAPNFNRVRFGGAVAELVGISSTQLVVRVPAGAAYGPVTVTVNGMTATSRERFNVTFASVRRFDPSFFGPRVDLPSGPIPIHMASGDIDGDGFADLIVANRDGANFTVYRNRGNQGSGFEPGVNFATGHTPYMLAVADIDGDWRLDVITADSGANTISVLANRSAQFVLDFQPRKIAAVGRRPVSLAVGDVNNDGYPDVVTGDYDDGTVSVLISQGGVGNFLPRVTYPTGGDPHAVAIADFTGDGIADLAVANYNNASLAFLRGTGNGAFAQAVLFAGGCNTLAVGDLDGDGDLDVVTGEYRTSTTRVYSNTGLTGGPQFAMPISFPAGTTTHQLALGDLDGDGRPDVAASGESPSAVSLLRNTTENGTGIALASFVRLVAGANETGLVLSDFNHDGKPDVAVANAYANSISWFRNNIPETEPPLIPPQITSQPQSISVVAGQTAIFQVEATGTPPLGYVWRRNGVSIPNSNTNRLLLPNVSSASAGGYNVIVSNAAGSVPSDTAFLSVITPTNPPAIPQGNLVSISNVWLYEASGTDLGADWSLPDYPDSTWLSGLAPLGMESNPALPVPIATHLPLGPITYYFRTVFNLTPEQARSNSQFRAHLLVDDGAVVYVNGVEALRLEMPAGPVTYNTLAVRSIEAAFVGPFIIPASLFVPGLNVIAVEVHQASVVSGDVVFGMTLNVQQGPSGERPVIVQQPQSQTVEAGGTAIFHVEATGTPPLGYRWRRNGLTLPLVSFAFGQGTDTLIISNVQPSHAGGYTVIITNSANPVPGIISSNAVLTVIGGTNQPPVPPLPPLITSFTPQSGPTGTVVTISGSNFSPNPLANRVYFGATRARVIGSSNNMLFAQVPVGATYEYLRVYTSNRVAYSDRPFVVTFDSSRSIHRRSFAGFNLPAGDLPIHVSMGDMTRDGKVDFVVANHYSGSVGVYVNGSTNNTLDPSSFGEGGRIFPTGPLPFHMALADLDQDGGLDVITANMGDHSISLLRNTPAGSPVLLGAPLHFPVGQLPTAVATGDLDKDGRTDIVVANHDSDSITILRQISNPFSPLAVVPFEFIHLPVGDGPHNIIIGDIDGDGRQDIAVANYQTPTMAVFRNLTTRPGITAASFAPAVQFSRGGNCMAFGDLDGDGRSDVAIGNWRTQTLSLFRNIASLGVLTLDSLAAPIDIPMGNNPHTIAFSDLEGDGRIDIALVGELGSYMSLFRNQSVPGEIAVAPRVDFATGWNAVGIAAGDLDGDARPDFVFANAYDDNITIYHNQTIIVPNQAPVALATAFPAVDFLSQENTYVFIDAGHGAVVGLDGSGSTDPDGQTLTYQWSINDVVLGTEPVVTNRLPVGSYAVALRVSDGLDTGVATITVEVIEPSAAVQALIVIVDQSQLPRRIKRSVTAALKVAMRALEHDREDAIGQLKHAQRKIQMQVGRENPEVAALLINALQEIIDAVQSSNPGDDEGDNDND